MQVFLGEIASLTAALLWAVSIVLFRSPIAAWGARAVNLGKCLIGAAMLALTLPLAGGFGPLLTAPGRDLALVALSGIVGLTLGDTALFAAVARLGAHRSLLIQTTAPVFAGLLAAAGGERLTAGQLAGAAVVLTGVLVVVGPGDPTRNGAARGAASGLVLALLAAFGQGAGVVLAKAGLATVAVLPATLVRLAAGAFGLFLVAAVGRRLGTVATAARDRQTMVRLVPAAVLGTYLALLLMTAGIAYAPATIAAVLLATTPAFGLVVEAAADRKWPSAVAVIGTLVAVVGVAILVNAGN